LFFLHEKTKSFISIYLGTKVKPGLLFPHGGPININPAVEIGENVIIHPNTLLGGNRKTGAPIIGDNVFIGNGAKLIGRIHVGNWVFISPGAVLTHDVPDDTVVGAGLNYFLRPQGGRIAVERYMKLQE
jgi:serine O-acetyltransferase